MRRRLTASPVRRDVLWTRVGGVALEHLRVELGAAGLLADGLVIGVFEGEAARVAYALRCDAEGAVRDLRVTVDGPPGLAAGIALAADGAGRWTEGGIERSDLTECIDVDISITPSTNTLPIRRLGLARGKSAEIRVVYVDAPRLEVRAAAQRYTCLARTAHGATYRYQSLESGFTADLDVDEDDLVVDYPGIWTRLYR